jgi:hypothetical protein
MTTCRALACQARTKGRSAFCGRHATRKKRFGDVRMNAVRDNELDPYRRHLRALMDATPDNALWPLLDDRWSTAVNACRATVRTYRAGGVPACKWEIDAAEIVVQVGEEVETRVVIETALAAYLLGADDPGRFVNSDMAFVFGLGRNVRRLAPSQQGKKVNPRTGKLTSYCHETRPRVARRLGRIMAEVFGDVALRIIEQRRKADAEKAAKARAISDAVKELPL